LRDIFHWREAAGPRGTVHFVVNWEVADIFNRVFEVQKTAKKAVFLTENRVFETRVLAFTISALSMPAP
jgi:hypothetical protein